MVARPSWPAATSPVRWEGGKKMMDNPVNPVHRLRSAPRCNATSKRSHKPCQAPAKRGWSVCRFHGAGGGAPKGDRNGNWRHGLYESDNMARRRTIQTLLKEARKTLEDPSCD